MISEKDGIKIHGKHDHRLLNKNFLRAELSPSNYREKFHQLLCCEEEEHYQLLKEKYV